MATNERPTLTSIENDDWGPPTYDSHLIETVHVLRHKPLEDFTVEDLRIMIGQEVSLDSLLPLALGQLERNPLVEGDFYEGDLLKNVLSISPEFWAKHRDLLERVWNVVERLDASIELPTELALANYLLLGVSEFRERTRPLR